MKTALIHDPYWDTLGGGENYTASFVRLLLDLGWRVDIHWPQDISQSVRDRFGINISSANFIPQSSITNYQLLFWLSDGSLPTSFARKTLIHIQYPFRGIGGRRPFNFLKSRFYRFVVNSRFTKSFIDREFLINSTIVYPPVNTTDFSPGQKTKTILYVGRFSHLTQLKNPHILIDAFIRLSPKLPGWRLILAGGAGVGTDVGFLDQLRKKAAGHSIDIVTNPSFKRLRQLNAAGSLFWSASGYGVDQNRNPLQVEHFGITVIEAMAAGCVPLVVNAGGYPEIVDHGLNGFLWSDPGQLQEQTLQLIKQPGLLSSLSSSAVQKSKMFDISVFNDRFIKLI